MLIAGGAPIAQNQPSHRQYTWTAHTEISLKGNVKNPEMFLEDET